MLKYLTIAMAALGLTLPVAQAADKPELVVYTYDSFASDWGPGPQIKAEFEKTCNCTLTFVGLESSVGILSRIQLEGASTKADVALGLDTSLTSIAAETGLFRAHGLATRGTLALPADVGFWADETFVPFDWGYFAFNYDTSRLAKVPTSFDELLSADNDLKIVIQDPRTATPGLGLMLWVNAVYGDKAPEVWAKLAPKLVTVTKGWWDAYSMFLEGEADMVLSYSTSPAYHLIAEGKDNFAAAEFTDGHYMQVEVAGILKSSDKPALAALFLERLMEAEMQSILPTTNWMYPAAKAGAVPAGFDGLISPQKSFLFSPEEVARNRKAWTAAWVDGLSQ
ncbi:MAG: thiamine ABC transporter substrate binding subunit [Alphaproteobacteria bacterium]|nr:thiamine ABC transporter substrate binding subunit [Alphaproteobacteria bacterium]